jgi:hypothetical protein
LQHCAARNPFRESAQVQPVLINMKSKITPTKASRAQSLSVVAAALMFLDFNSVAQNVFTDDFELYADQAALNAVWINNSAAVSASLPGTPADGVILTNSRSFVPPISGTNAGATRWAHDRSFVNLPETLTAGTPDTPGTPALLTVYMYRPSVSTTVGATRNLTSVGASSSTSVVGSGWFNNATATINGVADVFVGTAFQGKHSGTGGNFYFNLTNNGCPRRTIGWHKFDIEMLPDGSTRYYVDNVLGRTVTNAAFNWSVLACGFGTTSAVPALPGEETDFDGIMITTNHPSVSTQPTNQLIAANATATFDVGASAPVAYPITGYQWFRATNLSDTVVYSTNYIAIPGATGPSLTINNASTTNQGLYFVVLSNSVAHMGSATARLIITAPSISSQTTTSAPLEGANFTLSVTAGGATPLSYQWFKEGNPLSGATDTSYTKAGVTVTDGSIYTVVVTNLYAAVTSSPITVTVITNPHPTAMSLLWSKLPADFTWLGTGNLARGLAYNEASNHVLIASRSSGDQVHVLDGETGSELHTLDPGIGVIAGGTFNINMLGVADDGAVYVCNLTLDPAAQPFAIYRYADDAPTTTPTVAYSGDPVPGALERWGDAMVVRGAGTDTQILVPSRAGTNVSILTTTDGVNFTANPLATDAGAGDLALGVAFGPGDTFWGKANDGASNGLYRMSFNLAAGTATTLKRYTNFAAGIANLGANKAGNLFAGIGIATPNDLRLFDITELGNDPLPLDWDFFTPNNAGFAVGNAAFGNNRLYALNANNGVLAMTLNWPQLNANRNGTDLILNWVGLYRLQSATEVAGPYGNVFSLPAAGPYTTNLLSQPKLFFRLAYP